MRLAVPKLRRLLAGWAVATAVVVGVVTPAGAHALLLRTVPSPQTTVNVPPKARGGAQPP